MYNIIALMGKSGAGKDTIMHELCLMYPELNQLIRTTSRPIREGEVDGVNYHYITEEEFNKKLVSGEFVEDAIFANGWMYGTDIKSLSQDKVNIGCFDITATRQLVHNSNCNTYVFYVQASDKTRLLRQLNRENNPNVNEIVRRFEADKKDYENLGIPYIEIYNDHTLGRDSNVGALLGQIEALIGQGQS